MAQTLEMKVSLENGAVMPSYATAGAAGMDVRCNEPVELQPLERKLVSTGLRIAVPEGYEAQIRPRSGLAIRHGLTMVNTPGTIDSDYRGEVKLIMVNLGQETVRLDAGERVAQMVICPVARVVAVAVDTLDQTERGEGGFGSTGTL